MKKNLLIISFYALLLVSSGISSQTTDNKSAAETFTSSTDDYLATEPARNVSTKNGLMLAKANIEPVFVFSLPLT